LRLVEAVKSRPEDVIFSILEDRSAWHTCNCCVYIFVGFLGPTIWPFSAWVVPVFCIITLRIWYPLFKFFLFVLSVTYRFHKLWSPFQIPYF
jgi:hypothetical protein